MFTLVVIAIAVSVVTAYVRHSRFMRRKRLAELAAGQGPAAKRDEPQ